MKAPKIRIFQTAIIVTILSCMLCSYASAATTRSSKYLDAYGVYLTPVGSGKVVITVDVDALHTMTKIGATKIYLEMSRNVQSGNTQNLKSMVIQRSFPKWSVAERRKTAAASD